MAKAKGLWPGLIQRRSSGVTVSCPPSPSRLARDAGVGASDCGGVDRELVADVELGEEGGASALPTVFSGTTRDLKTGCLSSTTMDLMYVLLPPLCHDPSSNMRRGPPPMHNYSSASSIVHSLQYPIEERNPRDDFLMATTVRSESAAAGESGRQSGGQHPTPGHCVRPHGLALTEEPHTSTIAWIWTGLFRDHSINHPTLAPATFGWTR